MTAVRWDEGVDTVVNGCWDVAQVMPGGESPVHRREDVCTNK